MDVSTERLEVQLPSRTVALLRQEAERRGIPEAQLMNDAVELLLAGEHRERVRAAKALFGVGAPAADWAQMKQEIEAAGADSGRP
jgi:hypothetical protein